MLNRIDNAPRGFDSSLLAQALDRRGEGNTRPCGRIQKALCKPEGINLFHGRNGNIKRTMEQGGRGRTVWKGCG